MARNCPWNKCYFCPAHKGEKFSLRTEKEVLGEIGLLAEAPGAELVKTVFLQDADALIIPAEKLAVLLRAVRQAFPGLERITAYARSATLCHRDVSALKTLKEAGLTRIHVGVESGSDEVLEAIKKGVSAAHRTDKRPQDEPFIRARGQPAARSRPPARHHRPLPGADP